MSTSEPPDFLVSLPDGEDLIGSMMRGHTMGPIKDGWVIYYYDRRRAPTDSVVNQLCVVKTKGGSLLIRYVHRGRLPGTWDLTTMTGPHMLDVVLEWAEPVVLIQPFEPNGEQMAKLAKYMTVSTE